MCHLPYREAEFVPPSSRLDPSALIGCRVILDAGRGCFSSRGRTSMDSPTVHRGLLHATSHLVSRRAWVSSPSSFPAKKKTRPRIRRRKRALEPGSSNPTPTRALLRLPPRIADPTPPSPGRAAPGCRGRRCPTHLRRRSERMCHLLDDGPRPKSQARGLRLAARLRRPPPRGLATRPLGLGLRTIRVCRLARVRVRRPLHPRR